ncbi:MAG: GNAT family N-acetyltransferase [Armatimonadetes bacterium]|nr:GNAT family N-acetyltransferase [Armatimonadota bacterium]
MADIHCRINPDAHINELLPHWTTVFGVPESVFTPVWEAMGPGRRILAEARVDGQIVSTVAVYLFEVSLGGFRSVQMPGVANVSTVPEFRGKGLSSELLRLAKEEMSGGFSLLYTGVPEHYAKVGYFLIPDLVVEIRPAGDPITPEPAPDRNRVQAIHSEGLATHPGAAVRDSVWWEKAVWFRTQSRLVWADIDAYLFADKSETGLTVIEAFGEAPALARLVNGAASWASANGMTEFRSRVRLPEGVESTATEHVGGAMVLPLRLDAGDSTRLGQGFLGIDHF